MIFLSHSSKDKDVVRRLAQDLNNAGVHAWLDESEVTVGESITEKVQEGLAKSEVVGIWLTRHSVSSGWVQKEWQAKFDEEASQGRIVVLPLLADNLDTAELPLFLRDKRFADFRTDYGHGLSQLLEAIKPRASDAEKTVAAYTGDLLEDLSHVKISFPLHKWIHIISTLQKLPRSGKQIRLETYPYHVPIRSVYDHILSIAHSADALFYEVKHGIPQEERLELARCIVYHDICEVLLGDIPAYTNLTDSKRDRARIFAERRLRELPPGESKRIATEFIRMFLDDRERESLDAATRILVNHSDKIGRFFYVLDKIDPIIAVWRYLHQFRGHLDTDANDFLKRMKDFFDNPDIKIIARGYKEDRAIEDLVLLLQDRRQAREYYRNANSIQRSLFSLRGETITRLIQGTELTFAPKRKRRNRAKASSPGTAAAALRRR